MNRIKGTVIYCSLYLFSTIIVYRRNFAAIAQQDIKKLLLAAIFM